MRAIPNEKNIIMDEFTLIYDNIVMALEMEQIDKIFMYRQRANNIFGKKTKCDSNTTNGFERSKKEELSVNMGGKAFGKNFCWNKCYRANA